MFRDGCVALPRGAMGVSAVCDCGISWSYSRAFFDEPNRSQYSGRLFEG